MTREGLRRRKREAILRAKKAISKAARSFASAHQIVAGGFGMASGAVSKITGSPVISVIGDPVPCLLHGTVTYALLPMTRDVNVLAHLARFLPRGRR